ncbi:cell division protein DivIVA [Pseudidiomarina tainanensis]|uniref:Cell division protein DivIVA n=2 Tax=Pseudidiomarina tainanensis TaxID=502365 RepID=A0ACD2HLJ6_9GAMM|nr:cell division protein DivIVA [Pseudidiomarina tainanensis]
MDANEVPLKRLVVQGELRFLERNQVRDALAGEELGSFFSADVNVIRERLEAEPWIEQASVRKEWPDILKVFLVEQKPLGHWNEAMRPHALVSAAGEVFEVDKSVIDVLLPKLNGPEHAVKETVEQYQQVSELLQINGHQVVALTLTERFAVDVELLSGIQLRLGREGLLERVQRFIDVFPTIVRHKAQPIDYVDLRYDTGVAVAWKEEEERK